LGARLIQNCAGFKVDQFRHCWFRMIVLNFAHPAFVARLADDSCFPVKIVGYPLLKYVAVLIAAGESLFAGKKSIHPIAP
jgi:hypothetical protein